MRRVSLLFLVVGCAGLFLSVAVGQDKTSPSAELRKLHALLVVDTLAGLGESVEIDGERLENALRHGIPKDRLDLKVLKGDQVTSKHILQYYSTLKSTRSEGLLFYYAGHGAIDVERGHFLFLQQGRAGNFYRSTLREAMVKKGAGLTVILTDCCSERIKVKKKRAFEAAPPLAKGLQPVFRCLFFQHHGLVDITAATDNCAFGDEHDGGLFTRTLGRLLLSRVQDLDTNRDGFVNWKEFFAKLQPETERSFTQWAAVARSQGEKIDQGNQKPHAFALSEGTTAAVTLLNETIKPIRYQYRWSSDSRWESVTLPGGDGRAHTPQGGNRFEVKMEGEEPQVLQAGKTYRYTGKRKTRGLNAEDPNKG